MISAREGFLDGKIDFNLHKRISSIIPSKATEHETIACTLGYTAGYEFSSKVYKSTVSYIEISQIKRKYAKFIKAATRNKRAIEYHALYNFLLKCFTDADVNNDGRVYLKDFSALIENAAAAPRRLGLAPTTSDIYDNEKMKNTARKKMFNAMDSKNVGSIGFEAWLGYCYDHIRHKAATLEITPEEDTICRNKETYLNYLETAVNDNHSPEYRELYLDLLQCFTKADTNFDGYIGSYEFDMLIEHATAQPRAFGLVPSPSQMYESKKKRIEARHEMFKKMDTDSDGNIAFDEWLKFALNHVRKKVKDRKVL